MSAALTPIPPWALKEILVMYGLRVMYEDDYNWLFDDPQNAEMEPIVIPKIGDVVEVDVMMDSVMKTKMGLGAYMALKEKVLGKDWFFLNPEQMKARAAKKAN
jgi:hypothetical protein